jgi:hypothetical protein
MRIFSVLAEGKMFYSILEASMPLRHLKKLATVMKLVSYWTNSRLEIWNCWFVKPLGGSYPIAAMCSILPDEKFENTVTNHRTYLNRAVNLPSLIIRVTLHWLKRKALSDSGRGLPQ